MAGLGITYIDLKNFEDAESCLRQAVELDKKMYWANYNLGLTLQQQKDYEGALRAISKRY